MAQNHEDFEIGLKPGQKSKNSFPSFSVIIVVVALMLIGAALVPTLSVQLEPGRSLPSLSIYYSMPRASAKVIEQEVTSKLEGVLNSIKGVKSISSISKKGNGYITLEFKKGSNLDALRFEVATAIRQVYPKLPAQVSYPYLSLSTSGNKVSSILSYTVNGSASPYFIQKYAEEYIVPKLTRIKGINEVSIYGATPFEWEIVFDSKTLENIHLSASDISKALSDYFQSHDVGMGTIQNNGDEYGKQMRVVLKTNSNNNIEWERIPVKKIENRIVWLTDIAKIKYKEKEPEYYYRINGLNTINMVIYPETGVNTLKLVKTVKETIKELETNLSPGYSLLLAYDNTAFIEKELKKIGYRTLFVVLILLLFVLLITRSFRYLLLILISLLANLLIAAIFYSIFNVEIHLYSLAGITVSFGILVDNSIIMIDHLRHQDNKRIFLAILAATLTTIGSLSIIFFLKAGQQINLIDFATVIMINLTASLLIALFFIPSLMDKIRLKPVRKRYYYKRKKVAVRLSRAYERLLIRNKKIKWGYIILLLLGFGIPIHWLPPKIEKEAFYTSVYNKTIGSTWYQDNGAALLEKIIGGSIRLFTENVFEKSFYADPKETKLYINGTMPEGCTAQQLNEAVKKMENFISRFDEIKMFQTRVNGYRSSNITIHFKPEFEKNSFPFFLKEELTSKANSLGGLDWSIYGVGKGFSNALHTGNKSNRIILQGYNYDRLYSYAEDLKSILLQNGRIKEVEIKGSNGYGTKALNEYFIEFNYEKLALNAISPARFYSFVNNKIFKQAISPVFNQNEYQPVSLLSDQSSKYNVWDLKNMPVNDQDKLIKFSEFGTIKKLKSGNDIYKYNQQYQLVVAYDFIGSYQLGNLVRTESIKQMKELLPMGYRVEQSSFQHWNKKSKKQYYLLFLIIAIIFILCSILFESFTQPLIIIVLIPVAYIGVFLTFYLFEINFDQGGFASFILLSGLVVNAGIYILNDYNNLCHKRPQENKFKLYRKAFNHKIIPIFLTIISTVLGLIPFIWLGQNEVFWFAFASGTIGGLIFSILAIVIYLPLFMSLRR